MIRTLLHNYRQIERHILLVILAEFCIQFINTSFGLIFNIHLAKIGYLDHQIADIVSYRFLGVLVIALPLGLFIKTRKIKPLLYVGTLTAPLLFLAVIACAEHHHVGLLRLSMGLLGIVYTCLEITVLPFILRNARRETQTEAIALNASVWALGTIVSGLVIFLLRSCHDWFSEKAILQLIACLGFASFYCIYCIKVEEQVPATTGHPLAVADFDWGLIGKALVPPAIIAIGAGLTIPFLNLFFYTVHCLDSDKFAIVNAATSVLVSFALILVPQIKRQYGYLVAITMTQSLAIVAMLLLGATEFYRQHWYALYVAIFFYMMRQPLMNMAGPMTSYLVMSYVGKRNHELVSALNSAVWSGSWYISSQIFRWLRQAGFNYASIVFITATIYVLGVIGYYLLIQDFQRRERQGTVTE